VSQNELSVATIHQENLNRYVVYRKYHLATNPSNKNNKHSQCTSVCFGEELGKTKTETVLVGGQWLTLLNVNPNDIEYSLDVQQHKGINISEQKKEEQSNDICAELQTSLKGETNFIFS